MMPANQLCCFFIWDIFTFLYVDVFQMATAEIYDFPVQADQAEQLIIFLVKHFVGNIIQIFLCDIFDKHLGFHMAGDRVFK